MLRSRSRGSGEYHPVGSVDIETHRGRSWHRGRRGSPSFGRVDWGLLTTRSGCECRPHHPGIVSRGSWAHFDINGRCQRVRPRFFDFPFVHLFYGRPSRYLREDDHEKVVKGDPCMPLLFAIGQHAGLVATQERMQGERLFAFLDNINTLTSLAAGGIGQACTPSCVRAQLSEIQHDH